MGKLYKENWYQKWQKKQIWANSRGCTGTGTGLYRYSPPEANLYRYKPTECNLYRYRSKVYRYRCAQNAQNVVFCVFRLKFIHRKHGNLTK